MHLHLEIHKVCHSFHQISHQTVRCVNHAAVVAFRAFLCSLAWPKLQSNLGTPIWNEVFTHCHETTMSLTRKSRMIAEIFGKMKHERSPLFWREEAKLDQKMAKFMSSGLLGQTTQHLHISKPSTLFHRMTTRRDISGYERAVSALAGYVAGSMVVVPFDRVKTLMQASPGAHPPAREVARSVWRKEGLRGLYRYSDHHWTIS